MAELTKTDNRQPMGKIKPTDKMVMMLSLLDGTKPAMSKQHYERFNLYINFLTKSGHLTDPVGEAIDLFEHTLYKTALVWFQMNRSKFKDLTTLKILTYHNRVIYINNGNHDNLHEPPQNELEGCDISQNTLYSHHVDLAKDCDEFEKLHYIYQHFQDSEKMHQIDPEREPTTTDDDSLYPYVNNDIEYGLFEDIVDSYYLDSQIKDDFQCDHDCYSQHRDPTIDNHSNTCTHDYYHITQSVQDLSDSTQQINYIPLKRMHHHSQMILPLLVTSIS